MDLYFKPFWGATLAVVLLTPALSLSAQQLLVANGGMFGGGNTTNFGLYDPIQQHYTPLDTVGTTSIQDAYIEDNRYLYIAAADSLFKYDLSTGQQFAKAGFGGVSALKIGLYQDELLVSNWYGMASGNLRIFDKYTLAYKADVQALTQGAADMVVVGDTAYITQNINDFSTNFQDSLGYLAVLHLPSRTIVRHDTLATQGEDLGRLWYGGNGDLYAFNSVSNTISYYHIPSATAFTVPANTDLRLNYYGNTIFPYNGMLYLPQASGIAPYNLATWTAGAASATWGSADGFGWAMDTLSGVLYVSEVFYSNQQNNRGILYNTAGDSIGHFPVGTSPEVLAVWYDNLMTASETMPAVVPPAYTLYPNPAGDYIRMQFAQTHPVHPFPLTVARPDGRVAYYDPAFDPQTTLSLQGWQSGVYLLITPYGQALFIVE